MTNIPVNTYQRKSSSASYKRTLADMRQDLNPVERSLSKIFHLGIIDRLCTLLSATILRPRPLLYGALVALIISIGIYTIAYFAGYSLSGSEVLLAFLGGWAIGILYDFFMAMAIGKR